MGFSFVPRRALSRQVPRVHPATTPVPPPVRGNIHQTVRAVTVTTKPPVALRAVADFGTGVTAQIMSVKAIEYQAVGPGQVSGPGLRLVIQIDNVNFSYAGGGPVVLFKGDAA
jgi:hypothetical protein